MNPIYRSRIGSTATVSVLAIAIALGRLPLGVTAQQLPPNLLEQIAAGLLIQKGAEQMNKGNFEAAIALYGLALDVYPQSADTCYQRGVARLYIKANQEAIAQFPTASPQMSADDYYERGLSRYAQRDWEGAIAAFTHAIQINPGDRDAYYRRGFAHCKLGETPQSNKDFRHASSLHPPALCINGVLRVDRAGASWQMDPIQLEQQALRVADSGELQKAIEMLQQSAKLLRSQARMSDYHRVQNTIIKLQP